jgi:hypothetical protein
MSPIRPSLLFAALATATTLAAACGSNPTTVDVVYDPGSKRILVEMSRQLKDGESLHARVRKGVMGDLSCKDQIGDIAAVDAEPRMDYGDSFYAGPSVDEQIFKPVYDDSWLEMPEPTAEMLAAIADGQAIIDVCLMNDKGVGIEQEFDIRRALDKDGSGGKADGEEEVIASTEAYADKCIEELGDIPFFKKIGDNDYETYDCLDSVPIKTTVTDADGNVTEPQDQVGQCDNPQYIYSLCEPNAVAGESNGPRVTSAANEDGTEWVLLCRKAKEDEGEYNDIAMVGHNPYTGKTCFFQNALYQRTDGLHVPHPGDRVDSASSPQQSTSLWDGIHGGLGSGIQCAKCHDADPLIHTPWIDQAKKEDGDPVVPKMGIDEDFVIGYADAPYSIINTQGQGWTMPKVLTSPEANACTRCHRIGNGRWSSGSIGDKWINRLVGEDPAWVGITTEAYRDFKHTFWMPPDLEGVTAATWAESDFGKAVKFIQGCSTNPSSCTWRELPTDPLGEDGELPTIDLEGEALARAAGAILGANVQDPSCPNGECASRRCAECHSMSPNGLQNFLWYTQTGLDECGLSADPNGLSQEDAKKTIDCLRKNPDDPTSPYTATKLGILATGVQYSQFRTIFRTAYGEGNWLTPYLQFKARVGMPKGNHAKLSGKEYATVLKWFKNGLENIDDVIMRPPYPTACEPSRDESAIAAHLDEMAFDGWAAVNKENGINMFGCGTSTNPRTCLASSTFPSRTSKWGNGTANGHVRELKKLGFATSYWTRSSPDGRFVANGGNAGSFDEEGGGDGDEEGGDGSVFYGATITDLQSGKDIPVQASYDPGFFPDNSAFIFQGAPVGAGVCSLSVLNDNEPIDWDEQTCSGATSVGLYQHVARGLGGGDYFVINSQWAGDPGGSTEDTEAPFDDTATMSLTPMVFNGTTYEERPAVVVDSPFQGDSVLSPSARLVVSRLAGADSRSLGYVIRRVNAVRSGSSYSIDIDQKVAEVCMPGVKPAFSLDERFMVTHHYHDGKSDILLYDLKTGVQKQITDVPEGTEARYPHFRSDGWIYFLVANADGEFVAASDAALLVDEP